MTLQENLADFPGVAGRCYLVTGASGGIGGHCARLLAALGATVIATGRNAERLDALFASLQGCGHVKNLADLCQTDFRPWLESLLEKAGKPLAGIAWCAGEHSFAPLRGFSAARLEKTIADHAVPAASLFYAVSRIKNREKECSLAIMTSISSRFGVPGNAIYGAARACMDSLCRSFAVEFAPLGIRCNAISGGFMEGGAMTNSGSAKLGEEARARIAAAYPLGLGQTSDAANALVFLLGRASRWISGAVIPVDGGLGAKGV